MTTAISYKNTLAGEPTVPPKPPPLATPRNVKIIFKKILFFYSLSAGVFFSCLTFSTFTLSSLTLSYK